MEGVGKRERGFGRGQREPLTMLPRRTTKWVITVLTYYFEVGDTGMIPINRMGLKVPIVHIIGKYPI